MDTTMNVGVHIAVSIANGVYHTLRFLGSCGIVKVNQRLTVNLTTQNWKIPANTLYVNHILSASTATLTL